MPRGQIGVRFENQLVSYLSSEWSCAVDFRQILDRHHVPYTVDAGEKNATLQCPFCGEMDTKKHDLAVSLKHSGWKCWRNSRHRGRSRTKLIQALLKCSWDQARSLAGEANKPPLAEDKSVLAQLSGYLGRRVAERPKQLFWPKEFKPLRPAGLGVPFWRYFNQRGYSSDEVAWLTEVYGLRYTVHGPFRYRVVIPIQSPDGRLLSWTARALDPDIEPRYKTLATDPEVGPAAVVPPGQSLLGLPLLWSCQNPEMLVMCEGPFDAMRISAVGHTSGVYGTCLFGLNASPAQAEILEELSSRFKRMRLVLDADAALRAFAVLQSFARLPIRTAQLPAGLKDPGAMTRRQVEDFIMDLSTGNRGRDNNGSVSRQGYARVDS